MSLTRLSQHELAVARRFDRIQRSRMPGAVLQRMLRTSAGAFLINTPLFLLPAKVNLQPKHRVLDVGCSSGAALRFLTARIAFQQEPVGLDVSEVSLRRSGDRSGRAFELVAGSASRMPFADESFDLVIAAHVLRHLNGEGFIRLLVESHRVLRPGGVVAVWEYAGRDPKRLSRAERWFLNLLGGTGTPRGYEPLAHWASDANFDVIENPNFRPFLFPPVRHVSMLARKPPADPTAST
jgi:SAM-dependent methyltransferase